MLVKGIIEQKVDIYSYRVRIPFLDKVKEDSNPTPTEDLSIATISTIPGIHSVFEEGDVVFIDFENDDFGDPVILGLLDRASTKTSYNNIDTSTLGVTLTANLPYETYIGDITPFELSSLRGIKGNLQEQISIQENTIETYMCEYGVTDIGEINYQFNQNRAVFVMGNLPNGMKGTIPLTRLMVDNGKFTAEFEGIVSTEYYPTTHYNTDVRKLIRIVNSTDDGWYYKVTDLNLPAWSLSSGTAIPENADLNSYSTEGNYHCSLSATATTISNTPYGLGVHGYAFLLKVVNSTSTSTYRRQELFYFNTAEHWVRYSANSGSTWNPWYAYTYKQGTTVPGIIKGSNEGGLITTATPGDDYAKPGLVYDRATSIASKSALDTQLTTWFDAMSSESERFFYITPSGTWSPFGSGYGTIVHIQKGVGNGTATFYGRKNGSSTTTKISSMSCVGGDWSNFQDIITDTGGTVHETLNFDYASAGNGENGSIQISHGTANNASMLNAKRTDTGTNIGFGIGSGGQNRGIYDFTEDEWMLYRDSNGVDYGRVSGNAVSTILPYTGSSSYQTFFRVVKPASGSGSYSFLISGGNAINSSVTSRGLWFLSIRLGTSGIIYPMVYELVAPANYTNVEFGYYEATESDTTYCYLGLKTPTYSPHSHVVALEGTYAGLFNSVKLWSTVTTAPTGWTAISVTTTSSHRTVTNNTSTSGAVSRNTNLLTMNTLSYAVNRTTSVGAADTNYTTYMARGESLLTSAPTASNLANGQIAWIYG